MPFAADIRHWPTPAAFAAHLAHYPPSICSWVRGITLHHTISPLTSDWRGQHSVENLRDYYANEAPWIDEHGKPQKGWSAGPHLFIAVGSPNPADDGIWQLTPLNEPGVHAVSFNATRWGVEIVGNYDAAPWPAPLTSVVCGTLAEGLTWLGLPATAINGHRDDPVTTKTCPGRAINLDAVRAKVAERLRHPPPSAYTSASSLFGAIGTARLTAAPAAQATARHGSTYAAYDIMAIADLYWRYAAVVGLNADLAWAQLLLETDWLNAWWAQRPRRNPAGIGVSGVTQRTEPRSMSRIVEGSVIGVWAQTGPAIWAEGASFPTWEHAARAHLGRLLLYAQGMTGTPDERALAQFAHACRPLDPSCWGAAPTLGDLGGRWAADLDYGAKIAALANTLR